MFESSEPIYATPHCSSATVSKEPSMKFLPNATAWSNVQEKKTPKHNVQQSLFRRVTLFSVGPQLMSQNPWAGDITCEAASGATVGHWFCQAKSLIPSTWLSLTEMTKAEYIPLITSYSQTVPEFWRKMRSWSRLRKQSLWTFVLVFFYPPGEFKRHIQGVKCYSRF